MLEGDENDGVPQNDDTNGNGAEASKVARIRKRVLTSDMSARIAELEGRIEVISAALSKRETPSPLERQMAELVRRIAKLDERVTKIAHAVAQSNLMRGSLS